MRWLKYLPLLMILSSCNIDGKSKEVINLEALSKECVNTCPHGVKSFESTWSTSKCECKL